MTVDELMHRVCQEGYSAMDVSRAIRIMLDSGELQFTKTMHLRLIRLSDAP